MTFVTLDNKDWCKGIYKDGALHTEEIPKDLRRTWKYSSFLEDKEIEFAYLYVSDKQMTDVCPDHLSDRWQSLTRKLKAYHSSFVESRLSLEDNCFFDLVPEQFLLELCETKVQIINFVLDTHKKPENYNFLLEIEKELLKISEKKINIDCSMLKSNLHDKRARFLLEKVKQVKPFIDYNLFGSKTGRLTVRTGSFPILNLDTKYKNILKPTNDLFLELDYNAAELRTLLSLSGQEQPKEDIHSWNAKRLNLTREEAKQQIFSWLYGSTKIDSSKFKEFFKLNKIMDQFYDGSTITNLYNRKINSDQFHSLNYLIQSTTSDLVLEQFVKLTKILKNKKSFVCFLVHDSIVIDLHKEDRELVKVLIKEFGKTRLGEFPVNTSVGKNYGELKKI